MTTWTGCRSRSATRSPSKSWSIGSRSRFTAPRATAQPLAIGITKDPQYADIFVTEAQFYLADTAAVGGVGDVVVGPGVEQLGGARALATGRPLRVEAEVVEDPPGHRRLGDEGDVVYDLAQDAWTAVERANGPERNLWSNVVEGPDGALYGVGSPPHDQRAFYYRFDAVRNAWTKLPLACGFGHLAFDGRRFLQVDGPLALEVCMLDVETGKYTRTRAESRLPSDSLFVWTGREALVWGDNVRAHWSIDGRSIDGWFYDGGAVITPPPVGAANAPRTSP